MSCVKVGADESGLVKVGPQWQCLALSLWPQLEGCTLCILHLVQPVWAGQDWRWAFYLTDFTITPAFIYYQQKVGIIHQVKNIHNHHLMSSRDMIWPRFLYNHCSGWIKKNNQKTNNNSVTQHVQRLFVFATKEQKQKDSVERQPPPRHHVGLLGYALCGCVAASVPPPGSEGWEIPPRTQGHPHLWKCAAAQPEESHQRSGEGNVTDTCP